MKEALSVFQKIALALVLGPCATVALVALVALLSVALIIMPIAILAYRLSSRGAVTRGPGKPGPRQRPLKTNTNDV